MYILIKIEILFKIKQAFLNLYQPNEKQDVIDETKYDIYRQK